MEYTMYVGSLYSDNGEDDDFAYYDDEEDDPYFYEDPDDYLNDDPIYDDHDLD